ncbi:hypothetical protein L9F63_027428, partial [Diploptera punctata]
SALVLKQKGIDMRRGTLIPNKETSRRDLAFIRDILYREEFFYCRLSFEEQRHFFPLSNKKTHFLLINYMQSAHVALSIVSIGR